MEKRRPQGKTGLATFLKSRHQRYENDALDRRERIFSDDWGISADSLEVTKSSVEMAARVINKHVDHQDGVYVLSLLNEIGIDLATGFLAVNLLARSGDLKVSSDDKGIIVSGQI